MVKFREPNSPDEDPGKLTSFVPPTASPKVLHPVKIFVSTERGEGQYYYHYNSMAPFIAKMMRLSPTTPEKIARRIHKVITSKNPPLRMPVTIDAYIFGLLRKLLPRSIYHWLMYYSLPKIYRWGEDEHYHMDAEYERSEELKTKETFSSNLRALKLLGREESKKEIQLSS